MGDIELEVFSERLKSLRLELNMTQKEFAEKIGVTAAALSAYENNQKNPSIAVAKRISEKFNISLDWLCGLNEQKNKDNKILTYADMFRLIIKLCDTDSFFGDWSIEYIEDKDPFLNETEIYASLRNYDETIVLFFKDWQQMHSLYKANTIDKHLYNLWLLDKLKQYENKLLCPT